MTGDQPGPLSGATARHLLDALTDTGHQLIVACGLDGTVWFWTPAAQALLGSSAPDMTNRPLHSVLAEEHRADLHRALEHIGRGEIVDGFLLVGVAGVGSAVTHLVRIYPVRAPGGPVTGACLAGPHVPGTGGEKPAEADHPGPQDNVGDDRSRRFLADAAHQLRTPLARIQLTAETLLQGVDATEQDQLMADVIRETTRGSKLVTKLLQLARIDQGQPVNLVPTDLLDLCSDEADRAWALAPELDVVLRATHLPGHPLMLDPVAVREIVANLLDNARRHAATAIDLVIDVQQQVEVRVGDDGPGLAAGTETVAFERFASLDGRGGSGLGLAISRDLARACGGDLTYQDKTFVLGLPMLSPPPEG